MQIPVQVVFQDVPVSRAAESAAVMQAQALEECHTRVKQCKVVIAPHQQIPRHYAVRIDLAVPGRAIAINRRLRQCDAHADLGTALHSAFETARRRLEDYTRFRDHQGAFRPDRARESGAEMAALVPIEFTPMGYPPAVAPSTDRTLCSSTSVVNGLDRKAVLASTP